jgi:hypothetical protein
MNFLKILLTNNKIYAIIQILQKHYKINEGVKLMSYFVIERNDQWWDNVDGIANRVNMVQPRIDMLKSSTYDEMKKKPWLEGFVMAVMEEANELSGTGDDQTIITLVGDDDVFVWSIIMGPGENDMIRYTLVDWKRDGKSYRYAPEKSA